MKSRGHFSGQVVVIIGASGGLGSAFARAFADRGARLILTARSTESVAVLAETLGAAAHAADITRVATLDALRDAVIASHGRIDVVINATGYDVRKPLAAHTDDDIRRSVDVNLVGAVNITRAFAPIMRTQGSGTITHLGGFADGRLSFPYYSVDVATRAGVFSFIESVNRELAGSGVVVQYFSPSPADTAAEQPFHPMWKRLGTPIVSVEAVADALVQAVAARRQIAIMGGAPTRLFARINSVMPRLADVLLLNRYRRVLREFLAPDERPPSQSSGGGRSTFGLWLIMLSFVLYGLVIGAPLLPVADAAKVGIALGAAAISEIAFWVGGGLVGAMMAARYRRCLNPCLYRVTRHGLQYLG